MFPILFLLTTNLWAIEPTGYIKKPDITAKSEVVGSQIHFQYGFKDLKGEYQEWSWNDDYTKLKDLSAKYGINVKDPGSPRFGEADLAPGLFEKHPLVGVIPSYSKLVSVYQNTVVDIYRNWDRSVQAMKLNRRESIELLLRFLQDYPYGIPPAVIGRRLIGGLFVPPMSLENGWADCDSKSLLMATILSYDSYFKDKMAIILVPGHALLGIEGMASPYDETYKYQNRTFIVAEPTGPGRTPFGRKNSPYSRLIAIIPLAGPANSYLGTTSTSSGLNPLVESDCPEGGLLVELFSNVEKAKMQVCMIKEGENYIKHGPLLKYDSSGQPKEKENYNHGKKI